MRQLKLLIGLILLIVAVAGAHSIAMTTARDGKAKETKFKVRVENIEGIRP
jgi:predicted Na+-dependent transporter